MGEMGSFLSQKSLHPRPLVKLVLRSPSLLGQEGEALPQEAAWYSGPTAWNFSLPASDHPVSSLPPPSGQLAFL